MLCRLAMPLEPTDKGRRADRKQKKRVAERKVKSHELGALADVASPSGQLFRARLGALHHLQGVLRTKFQAGSSALLSKKASKIPT